MDDIDRAQDEIERAFATTMANRPKLAALTVSATHCDDCDDAITEARRAAVAGCRLCADCAAAEELRERIKRGGRW